MEAYHGNLAYLAQIYGLLKTHYEHLAAGQIIPEETQQVKAIIEALDPLRIELLASVQAVTANKTLLIYFPASAGSGESRGQIPNADNALAFTQRLQEYGIKPEVYCVDPNFVHPSTPDAKEIARYPPGWHSGATSPAASGW